MTDNGDGTSEADFMVSASSGTVSIVVQGVEGGLDAEYFTNTNWSGTPEITQIDDQIDFPWGYGNITPLSRSNYASVKWSGVVIPPSTGTYTFTCSSIKTKNESLGQLIRSQTIVGSLKR